MMEIYWQPPSDRKDCGYSSGSFYSTNLRVLSHLVGPLNRLDQGDSSPHSSTGQKKRNANADSGRKNWPTWTLIIEILSSYRRADSANRQTLETRTKLQQKDQLVIISAQR